MQGQEPLTASMLASAPPQEQKQMLGKSVFSADGDLLEEIDSSTLGMSERCMQNGTLGLNL